jgi:hypothetical protein
MAMQTRAAEIPGVTFPICAASHYRDAVVAATERAGFADEMQRVERVGP